MAHLGDAMSRGVLTHQEFEVRMAAALAARGMRELRELTADLPADDHGQVDRRSRPRRRWWRQAGFDYDATAYVLVNGMLVGIWGLTGHHFFWPFFPIAGWGIGIGAHGVTASHVARYRNRRDADRQLGRGRQAGDVTVGGAVTGLGPAVAGEAGEGALARVAGRRPSGQRHADPGRHTAGGRPRTVTVLFADMVGSTGLNERLGDAEFNRVRTRCLQVMRDCVRQQHGSEVSSQGDGLFARFDTPAGAVRAAVAMQQWAEERAAGGDFPRLHIGVHAGQAIEDGGDLVGNMVNLAARVTAVAAAGQILVTEPVADLAEDGVVFDDFGMHTLKGISRPRHLLAVRR